MAYEGTYSEGNSVTVEAREETVHSVILEVSRIVVVAVVVVVVLNSAKSFFSVLRSTAANNEVIGGSLTCSGAFASDSSGRLPIDCTELLLEVIPLVLVVPV